MTKKGIPMKTALLRKHLESYLAKSAKDPKAGGGGVIVSKHINQYCRA
jgi:hypothetical protein